MTGTSVAAFDWLSGVTPAAVLIVWALAQLIRRILSVVELRMVLRSLPPTDRIVAATAYFGRHGGRGRAGSGQPEP